MIHDIDGLTFPFQNAYTDRLMSDDLPDRIDPWRAVARGLRYAGQLPVVAFERLRPLLVSSDGTVEYGLRFGRDANRRALVWLEARARLRLSCQRCLGIVDFPVDARATLALVQGFDEAASLPDEYDPLLLSESKLCPMQLIEDELLLAIPDIPRHAAGACLDLEVAPESAVANPFAGLADWKKSLSHH